MSLPVEHISEEVYMSEQFKEDLKEFEQVYGTKFSKYFEFGWKCCRNAKLRPFFDLKKENEELKERVKALIEAKGDADRARLREYERLVKKFSVDLIAACLEVSDKEYAFLTGKQIQELLQVKDDTGLNFNSVQFRQKVKAKLAVMQAEAIVKEIQGGSNG